MLPRMRLGACLRSGEGIGWLAVGIIQTLSIECLSSIFDFVIVFLSFCRFCFVFVFLLFLELCRGFSDFVLSSRPRTGLATTYITGYG